VARFRIVKWNEQEEEEFPGPQGNAMGGTAYGFRPGRACGATSG